MLSGHAFVFAGGHEGIEAVFALLREEGIALDKNPDLYVRRFGQFGIGDARQLAERAALRAIGERRIFIIIVDSMNTDAQNALLKTLEEPAGRTLFFFIHPAPETLLPTVRSRVQMLFSPHRAGKSHSIDVSRFLAAKPALRLDMLKPLLEKDEDDHRDLGDILAFLLALEKQLEKDTSRAEPSGQRLHALYRARRYIGDRGALVKPLLEQVALLA